MSSLRPGFEPSLPAFDLERDWERPQGDDPRTLHKMLLRSVARNPEHEAFSYVPHPGMQRMDVSYSEFGSLVDACARALRNCGVGGGARVALVMENRVEWATLAYASNALGAVYTSMYVDQHADEWLYIIADCTPEVIVCGDTTILDRLVKALSDSASDWPCRTVVLLDDEPANAIPPTGIEVTSWQEFISSGRVSEPLRDQRGDHAALAALIYTSGSTGRPKGVMLSNWNMLHNVLSLQGRLPLVPGDRAAALLPWMHSFGNTVDVHTMLHNGLQVCLISDRERIAEELQEIRPVTMTAVPQVWSSIHSGVMRGIDSGLISRWLGNLALRSAGRRIAAAGVEALAVEPVGRLDRMLDRIVFKRIRARFGGELLFCLSGAAALSPEVGAFLQKLGISVFEGYGLTETGPVATSNGWEEGHPCRLGSVGRPLPGVSIEIDADAWDDPDSEDGEIVIRGPNVMIGYWNMPEESAAALREDGGLRTGDLGRLEDGFLHITGRLKSQFKLQNGKYVSPAPLEEDLKLSPLVEQCVLDGRGMEHTFLIVHPDEEVLRAGLSKAGIPADGTLEELSSRQRIVGWLLEELRRSGMQEPVWKAYERPRAMIIDAERWSVENGMLTPSLKTRANRLLDRHAQLISEL